VLDKDRGDVELRPVASVRNRWRKRPFGTTIAAKPKRCNSEAQAAREEAWRHLNKWGRIANPALARLFGYAGERRWQRANDFARRNGLERTKDADGTVLWVLPGALVPEPVPDTTTPAYGGCVGDPVSCVDDKSPRPRRMTLYFPPMTARYRENGRTRTRPNPSAPRYLSPQAHPLPEGGRHAARWPHVCAQASCLTLRPFPPGKGLPR
jgi:hypothetical protein